MSKHNDVIEAEYRPSDLAVRGDAAVSAPAVVPSLFNTDDPDKFVTMATKKANALVKVIEAKGLSKSLNSRNPNDKFVELEGWQLLGGMSKVYAVIEWTKEIEGGWEARAQAFTIDGAIVGAAEAVCLRSEKNWANRDSFALMGMAQTRAMSRALRAPLGFIMTLAGYKATAAEEIAPDDHGFKSNQGAGSGESRVSTDSLEKLTRGFARLGLTASEIKAFMSKATSDRISDPDRLRELTENEARRVGKLMSEEVERRKNMECDACGARSGDSHQYDNRGFPCPNDCTDEALQATAKIAALDRPGAGGEEELVF